MKRIVRLTESDLARIVKRVINERQYLMEGLGNTTLQLVTGPAAVSRTVCSSGMDQFLVTFTVKNNGAEIAYLTRVIVSGKGLSTNQLLDHKVSIGGVSKHSNHDNGEEQSIVPVGKTATVTVIAKTSLQTWNNNVKYAYDQWVAEKNPRTKETLKKEWEAKKAEPKFGNNQISVEYNGGLLRVPLDTAGLVVGNTTCEAAIDLARGF